MTVQKHVLIIEDDEGYAYALARCLSQHGLRTTIAPDGLTGMEAMDRDPGDLVLLDARLPDVPGEQVAIDIRVLHQTTPIIGLTAYPHLMWGGVDMLLQKPIDPQDVFDRLRPLLDAGESTSMTGGE